VEVGSAFVTLIPSAKGFGSAIDRQIGGDLKGAGQRGGRAYGVGLTGGLQRESKGLKGVGASGGKAIGAGMTGAMAGVASKVFLPIAAAMGGLAIGKFFAEGVQGASDLQEAGSAVQAVFGSAAGDVQRFAASANKDLGQTRLQALNAAQTFGTFGKAAGLSGKSLGGFSTDLVTLSADLASFKNTSPEQAIEAIGAALRGESEPIRAYGVLLDEATLRQRALSLGIIDNVKNALTPQQKVLAAQAEIFAQTTDAQGDQAKTSKNLAGQQKILTAQWQDFKTTLGGALIPLITGITTAFNGALGPAMTKVGPLVTKVSDAFTRLFSGVGGDGPGFLTPLIEGFRQLGKTVGPALASLAGPVKAFFGALIPVFRDVAKNVMGTLVPGLQAIGDAIANKLIPAARLLLPVLAPVAAFLLRTLGGAITGALSGAIKVIQGIITAISGLVTFVVNIFQGNWSAAWAGLKDVVSGAFKAIVGAIQVFLNVGILKAFRVGLSLLAGLWRAGINALRSLAAAIWNSIVKVFTGALRGIATFLGQIIRVYVGAWRGLFSTIINVLKSGWSTARNLFTSALNTIKGVITGAISGYMSIWRGLFTKMLSAVTSGINSVRNLFSGLKGKITGAISGAGSWLIGTGRSIVNGLIAGIRNMGRAVVNALLALIPGPLKKFAGALGINSPSTVFEKFGKDTVAGYVQGIDKSGRNVTASVARLADTAQKAVGGPLRPLPVQGGMSAPTGAGIAFYGPVTTTDVDRLAREITKRQRDALVLAGAMGV
jgi:phage-related protein